MFEKFMTNFHVTEKEVVQKNKSLFKDIPELFVLFDSFGGQSFNNGLYRVHSFDSCNAWSFLITEYFDNYKAKIYPFAFDWMGRQFCMSTTNKNILLMFDPATGEDFELQQNLASFHDDDLVNDTDDMLANFLYEKILDYYHLKSIGYKECIGYSIPLFLGGKDNINNYEKCDLEVYWHIQNQFYKKIQNLPGDTDIKSISID